MYKFCNYVLYHSLPKSARAAAFFPSALKNRHKRRPCCGGFRSTALFSIYRSTLQICRISRVSPYRSFCRSPAFDLQKELPVCQPAWPWLF
jgi:hypothetical protein